MLRPDLARSIANALIEVVIKDHVNYNLLEIESFFIPTPKDQRNTFECTSRLSGSQPCIIMDLHINNATKFYLQGSTGALLMHCA